MGKLDYLFKIAALELIDFALTHDVDYIYILEDLKLILEGKKTSFNKEDYYD